MHRYAAYLAGNLGSLKHRAAAPQRLSLRQRLVDMSASISASAPDPDRAKASALLQRRSLADCEKAVELLEKALQRTPDDAALCLECAAALNAIMRIKTDSNTLHITKMLDTAENKRVWARHGPRLHSARTAPLALSQAERPEADGDGRADLVAALRRRETSPALAVRWRLPPLDPFEGFAWPPPALATLLHELPPLLIAAGPRGGWCFSCAGPCDQALPADVLRLGRPGSASTRSPAPSTFCLNFSALLTHTTVV